MSRRRRVLRAARELLEELALGGPFDAGLSALLERVVRLEEAENGTPPREEATRMTAAELLTNISEKLVDLDMELHRRAAEEAAGQERPDLQRVCMVAMPVLQARSRAIKELIAEDAGAGPVVVEALALDRDLTALLLVLQGKLRLTNPEEN